MEIIVYDLDGTLRDTSCGDPYVPEDKTKPENWYEWRAVVNEGGGVLPTCNVYEADVERQDDCSYVYILTSSQCGTYSWLLDNNLLTPRRIIERSPDDCRHPVVYKKEWIDKHHADVVKWVDDSKEVCDYIRTTYPHIEVVEVGQPELTDLPEQIELALEVTMDLPKKDTPSVLDVQEGGDHYKNKLQPWEIINACNLDYYEGNALKYLLRHRNKNGAEDIKKAIHYLQAILEFEYDV